MKLNLEIKNDMERRIFTYLEENASETLAEKINNGVLIEKDGQPFINKKTLSGFVKYATNEARKLAEKGAQGMFVDDPTVYGWAIHYFEEDSIEETLYNQDGTEYKPAKKVETSKTTTTKATTKKADKKPNESQYSLFDMMLEKGESIEEPSVEEDDDKLPSEEEIQEILQEIHEQEEQEQKGSPIYQRYMELQKSYPDRIIAYRLGDFYEIFGDNAKTAVYELDLTLTGRDCGLKERVPMVGFPFHKADDYFNKLAKKHKVVAFDSTGEITFYPPEEDEFDLTENEMREFDGDIEDDDLQAERDFAKAFEKTSLIKLDEIFRNKMILR